MIALVAAMGRNLVIGRDGQMPWHLPADLRHFRRVTKGHVVVMGRKTYESIGAALKERTNLVLTRDPQFRAPNVTVVHTLDEVLGDERPLFVIGGAEVYRQFLPHAQVMHLTRIQAEFEGDTFFPAWHPDEWRLTDAVLRERDEKNAYDCIFETYERVGMVGGRPGAY